MNNLFSNPRFNFTLVVVLIFTQIKLIHDDTNIYQNSAVKPLASAMGI